MFKSNDPHRMRQFTLLSNYNFLDERLRVRDLPMFKQMVNKISVNIDFCEKYKNQTTSLGQRLKDMIYVVDHCIRGNTLTKTFRKLAIVHILLRISVLKNPGEDEDFTRAAGEVLETVTKMDCEELMKRKHGTNGLEKIGALLTGKSQQSGSTKSIENQSSKGAITEIVEKVYRPFSLYLLKMVQDRQMYSQIIQKQEIQQNEMLWKIINLTKNLGLIAQSLNRVYRYFKVELEGILSHFSFIISLDAKLFYDRLRQGLSNNCSTWHQKINDFASMKEENYESYLKSKSDISSDTDFNETKHLLQELATVRQDLFWIYLNKELRQSLKHFDRPNNGMRLEPNQNTNHITFVQSFIDQNRKSSSTKEKRKGNHRPSIQNSLPLDFFQEMEFKDNAFADASTGLSIPESNSEGEDQLQA